MKLFLILVIVVLFIAGLALIPASFLIPQAAQVLTPILCPEGGVLTEGEMVSQIPATRGRISMTLLCVDEQGRERVPSALGTVLLFTGWVWLPLLPFILLVITLRQRGRARAAAQVPNVTQ